jgi:hypothetical protein
MRLREEIEVLLAQGAENVLVDRVVENRRLVRPLVARLWDPDGEIRERAARVLGHAAAAHPGLCQDLVRRLMWTLNDESATNGVFAVPALGELGRRAPQLLAPQLGAMVAAAVDDGLRLELLRALGAVAETAPELVAPHLPRLRPTIDRTRPEEVEALDHLELATGTETTS